jgi:hypothetical protein
MITAEVTKRHETAVMAIHVRWDPPEGSAVLTTEDLGPPLPDKDAARLAVQMRYPIAFYGEPMPGLRHIGVEEIIHVWKDVESHQRGARAVACIVQTSW